MVAGGGYMINVACAQLAQAMGLEKVKGLDNVKDELFDCFEESMAPNIINLQGSSASTDAFDMDV
jgi:hypothetical protein